jgi:hypothetical protein
MDAMLDELVAADEDLRARVSAAGRAAKAHIAEAEIARRDRDRDRAQAASARLEEELRGLASAADAEIEERRRSRATWIAARREKGQGLISSAARLWAGIVRDGVAR